MQLFYSNQIKENLAYLDAEESLHCVKSLRKIAGDLLWIVDGLGHLYEGKLIEADKRACIVSIEKTIVAYGKRRQKLHIAIAPTKNNTRFEWFLEKATEIGIDRVTPIICKRSERRHLRTDRLKKIMISAMKQSLKAYLPVLDEAIWFGALIENGKAESFERFIAFCSDDPKPHLKDVYQKGRDALILIGPEGDFTADEISMALDHGFQGISLGGSRLRTETAGLVACEIINLLNE